MALPVSITGSILSLLSKGLLIFAHDPLFFYAFNIIWGISVTFFSGAEEALVYESLKESGEEHRMSEAMGTVGVLVIASMSGGQNLIVATVVFFYHPLVSDRSHAYLLTDEQRLYPV